MGTQARKQQQHIQVGAIYDRLESAQVDLILQRIADDDPMHKPTIETINLIESMMDSQIKAMETC